MRFVLLVIPAEVDLEGSGVALLGLGIDWGLLTGLWMGGRLVGRVAYHTDGAWLWAMVIAKP
ncbi:hypothetical protein, partial [Stenotrophomonas maltophilia]|uniref:hypothetical protein n=1 Tax=Stenotrophomonas maltophilia TaxID=40324 RepID=UPI00314561F6